MMLILAASNGANDTIAPALFLVLSLLAGIVAAIFIGAAALAWRHARGRRHLLADLERVEAKPSYAQWSPRLTTLTAGDLTRSPDLRARIEQWADAETADRSRRHPTGP
jgi:hypothetical protein